MMLVSSIGYFNNNAENVRRVDSNKVVINSVATKGLPASYKADGKYELSDILKSFINIFSSQSRLRKNSLDMIV